MSQVGSVLCECDDVVQFSASRRSEAERYIENTLEDGAIREIVVIYGSNEDEVIVILPEGLAVNGIEVTTKLLNELDSDASFKRVVEAGVLGGLRLQGARLVEYRASMCCSVCRINWVQALREEVEDY